MQVSRTLGILRGRTPCASLEPPCNAIGSSKSGATRAGMLPRSAASSFVKRAVRDSALAFSYIHVTCECTERALAIRLACDPSWLHIPSTVALLVTAPLSCLGSRMQCSSSLLPCLPFACVWVPPSLVPSIGRGIATRSIASVYAHGLQRRRAGVDHAALYRSDDVSGTGPL